MAPKKAFPAPEPEPEPEEEMDLEDDEEDEEDEDYEGMMDPGSMLASFLTTEDGEDNVCTALVTIGNHMDKMNKLIETQNKILVKLLSHLTKTA